eukprot:CAMPEP_0183295324 /NCGR_PEP_ID=MMETSP0160_2-20130417/3328_1 /TAXON_ID=2839 ORGANISM="Odontella Sinensis, Strain Grunow 1884" /NCGR_SAMPLE_ID=MMETSP0160_2 /ASSEMBLY_ACC=CAM_ASM_000250 /LENGTH=162 /DNA_ID=CAMNT_0025456793 /DNA_START=32 /DNA_END=520 /DNA_ORIENTATION=+
MDELMPVKISPLLCHSRTGRNPLVSIVFVLFLALNPAQVASSMCVATDNNQYVCVDNQSEAKKVLADTYGDVFLNRGVQQRIDGSEAEREAVKDILDMMEDYFLHEVFGRPEYSNVRGRCKNMNELCAFWTSVGECETNRGFMLNNCAAACRLCLLQHTSLE